MALRSPYCQSLPYYMATTKTKPGCPEALKVALSYISTVKVEGQQNGSTGKAAGCYTDLSSIPRVERENCLLKVAI